LLTILNYLHLVPSLTSTGRYQMLDIYNPGKTHAEFDAYLVELWADGLRMGHSALFFQQGGFALEDGFRIHDVV